MASYDAEAAVVGGGVVGCAVAHALASRGVETVLLEARPRLGTAASGTNSGILHTGFDSTPGELETELILRAAVLRRELLPVLGVKVRRCGAILRGAGEEQLAAIARLAATATGNGVEVEHSEPGRLLVPGESIVDPTAFTAALGAIAAQLGATVRTDTTVERLAPSPGGGVELKLRAGGSLRVRGVANCAGLHADEIAGGAAAPFEIYPRKGEFLVFAQTSPPLEQILLPVPSSAGKGVLVFPTVDGHVIAGPTARDHSDKEDWSVEPDAAELILEKARRMWPALEGAEPIAAYAGLRPAGRSAANYAIAPSVHLPGLVDAGAIRSTGLTAALAIGERVASLLAAAAGLELDEQRQPVPLAASKPDEPWWRLAAAQSGGSASR